MWVVSNLSHLHWGEKKTLKFCTAPFPLPAKVNSMDESASQHPPHPVTLYFLFPPCDNQLSASLSLQFLSPSLAFHPHLFIFSIFLILTFLHFPLLSHSLLHHAGIMFFSKFSEKRRRREITECLAATENSQRIQRWPQFSARFLHFLFALFAHEELQSAVWEAGSGRLVNIRGHLEILEHQPSLKLCQGVW